MHWKWKKEKSVVAVALRLQPNGEIQSPDVAAKSETLITIGTQHVCQQSMITVQGVNRTYDPLFFVNIRGNLCLSLSWIFRYPGRIPWILPSAIGGDCSCKRDRKFKSHEASDTNTET